MPAARNHAAASERRLPGRPCGARAFAMLNEGYLEKALVITSSFTSEPRFPTKMR